MQDHRKLSDKEFEKQFENCLLPPNLFTHEAHLRLAYLLIKKHELDDATEIIISQIKQFIEHIGATDKFNLTVTIAAMNGIYHFMEKSKSRDFSAFIEEFPRLRLNFRELMATHYSSDIFGDVVAKSSYIEPDLMPFD